MALFIYMGHKLFFATIAVFVALYKRVYLYMHILILFLFIHILFIYISIFTYIYIYIYIYIFIYIYVPLNLQRKLGIVSRMRVRDQRIGSSGTSYQRKWKQFGG